MILSPRECLSIIKDRDYLTIIFIGCFCLSLAGLFLNIFGLRDSGLFLMAVLLSRLLFIYRAEAAFDNLSKQLMKRMDAERSKPGFQDGNLGSILENEFRKFSAGVKRKCINKLECDNEIELSKGNYIFYSKKIIKQQLPSK